MNALTRPTPSVALDTRQHHTSWTTANAKPRAAAACRDYEADTLASLVTGYMHERDNPSRHTISAYRTGVVRYVRWAQQTGVSILHADANAGTRYRADLQDTYGTPGSVNTRLVGASSLFRALAWIGLEHLDPFQNVQGVRDRRPPHLVRDRYTDAEIAALLNAAHDAADRCIILLGAHAGLRLNEMLQLRWADVRLPDRDSAGAWTDAGEADVQGKGDAPATVPLGDDLMDALSSLDTPRDGFVLPVRSPSGVRHRLSCMATTAGIVADPRAPRPTLANGKQLVLGVHRLRHAFGTRVVEACGLDVGQVALRHASPTTTSRYVKGRDKRVAAFVRTLHAPAGGTA